MLAITRKRSEAIRIGKDIQVRVVLIKGRSVRLAIAAPHGVQIRRGDARPQPGRKGGKP